MKKTLMSLTCSECMQTARIVAGNGPIKYYRHHSCQGPGGFTIGPPLTYANDRLCYFHKKKKDGFFSFITENQLERMIKRGRK